MRSAPAPLATEAEADSWRGRRGQAQRQLAELEARLEYVTRGIRLCNRGRDLYTEDKDTGLRKPHSCAKVRREYEELGVARNGLQAYLSGGLEEECRRAGCLPGWVR